MDTVKEIQSPICLLFFVFFLQAQPSWILAHINVNVVKEMISAAVPDSLTILTEMWDGRTGAKVLGYLLNTLRSLSPSEGSFLSAGNSYQLRRRKPRDLNLIYDSQTQQSWSPKLLPGNEQSPYLQMQSGLRGKRQNSFLRVKTKKVLATAFHKGKIRITNLLIRKWTS